MKQAVVLQLLTLFGLQVMAMSWTLFPLTEVDELGETAPIETPVEGSHFRAELERSPKRASRRLPYQSVDSAGGYRRLTELFERVVVVDECRSRVLDELDGSQPCDVLGRDVDEVLQAQTRFTLAVTNCHLQAYGKQAFNDPKIYTQFHLHRERICSEISHENRQRSIEQLVSVLHQESNDAAAVLTELQSDASRALSVQQELLDGQSDIQDSVVESIRTVEDAILDSAISVQGQINKSMDISQNLSAVQLEGIRAHHLELGRIAKTSREVTSAVKRIDEMVANQLDTIEKASEVVERELAHLMPIWEAIYTATRDTNLSVRAWKTLVCYVFGAAFARWLSGLSSEVGVSLTVNVLYLCCMLLELTILPYIFGQLTPAAVASLRNTFAVTCVGVVVCCGIRGFVKSMKREASLQEKAMRVLSRIHANECARESYNREVLIQLIDQIVRWRLQAQARGVTLSIDSASFKRMLEIPPPGYESLSEVCYKEEAPFNQLLLIRSGSGDSSDEMFAAEDYGNDQAHSIVATDALEHINMDLY